MLKVFKIKEILEGSNAVIQKINFLSPKFHPPVINKIQH